jgi:hypothetical protein
VSPAEFDSWKATLTIRADAELMVEIRRGLEDIKKYASFIPLKSHSLSK